VTRESHALALDEGVFTWKDPTKIARSLKHSAEESTHRKTVTLGDVDADVLFEPGR
jgi:hypothetical protein